MFEPCCYHKEQLCSGNTGYILNLDQKHKGGNYNHCIMREPGQKKKRRLQTGMYWLRNTMKLLIRAYNQGSVPRDYSAYLWDSAGPFHALFLARHADVVVPASSLPAHWIAAGEEMSTKVWNIVHSSEGRRNLQTRGRTSSSSGGRCKEGGKLGWSQRALGSQGPSKTNTEH